MADVTCPECGLVATLPGIRRSADEFCRHCDYPLFWAPAAAPFATDSVGTDATLRRLPGVGGRRLIGTEVCPTCGELNPMSETHCIRCGADMHPVEEPEPPPPPAPLLPPPVVEPEPKRSWWQRWWPWVVVGVAAAGVVCGIVLAVTR